MKKNLKSFLSMAKEAISVAAKGIFTHVVKPVVVANTAVAKAVFKVCVTAVQKVVKAVVLTVKNVAIVVTQTIKKVFAKVRVWCLIAAPFCYVLLIFVVGTFAPLLLFAGLEWVLQATGIMATCSGVYLFFSGEAFIFTATLTSLICGDKLSEKLCKKEEHQKARAICQFVVFLLGVVYSCARYGLQTVGVSSADIAMFAAHGAAFGVFRQWGSIWAKAKEIFAPNTSKRLKGE